jgi:hypothetical protein
VDAVDAGHIAQRALLNKLFPTRAALLRWLEKQHHAPGQLLLARLQQDCGCKGKAQWRVVSTQ